MSLRARIILSFAVLVGLGFTLLVQWVMDELRPRYLESVEDSLVDNAQVLAALVAAESPKSALNVSPIREAFRRVPTQLLSAKIYELVKTQIDLRVYATDSKGLVVFDSQQPGDEGKDYSQWRNIYLASRGQYGARTSHETGDPNYSVLHVSAPIERDGVLLGVVTLAKPTTNINFFLESARPKIMIAGGIAALSVISLGVLVSLWVTYPLRRLRDYAHAVRDGRAATLPRLGQSEIGDMGRAFEEMREALEGKKYVENYVQTLTHEIKSPLAAIQGAGELLEENMPVEERNRFLANIRLETGRIQSLVDRMLELAALENRKTLRHTESLPVFQRVSEIAERFSPLLKKKNVTIRLEIPDQDRIEGEPFLFDQALTNVLQNAVDFSPEGGVIHIRGTREAETYRLSIEDEGPGVPDYALGRVFEKFYSLPRPQTGKKSTGLGLSFVSEIMGLHQGRAVVENRSEGGARLVLVFPLPTQFMSIS